MKNLKYGIAIVAATLGLTVAFQLIAAKIADDNVKVGNPNTASNKVLEFDTGDGTNNANISVDDASHDFSFNKSDILSFGDGSAANQTFTFNKGSGSTNPKIRWNNSVGKLQFSDDGSAYTNLNEETPLSVSNIGLSPGVFHNIKFTAVGTGGMKITSASGAALSAGNPAIFAAKGTSGGVYEQRLESDIQFDTAGLVGTAAADFAGNYDLTSGRAWSGGERDAWVAWCNKDDTVSGGFVMMSFVPRTFSPASTNDIGYIETAPAVAGYNNVFLPYTTPGSLSGYTSKPCFIFGAVRMSKTTTSAYFEVSDTQSAGYRGELSGSQDVLRYSTGHHGAANAQWVIGPNNPSWANISGGCENSPQYTYRVDPPSMMVEVWSGTNGCGNVTNGTDGNEVHVALPFPISNGQQNHNGEGTVCGYTRINTAFTNLVCRLIGDEQFVRFRTSTFTSTVNNNVWLNTGDHYMFHIRYRIKNPQ